MIPWWVALLLSGACAVFVEYTNRNAPGGWLTVLPYTIVPFLLLQYGLFIGFKGAPHWLVGWTTWAIGCAMLRLVAVHFLADQEVDNWRLVVLGTSLMVSGSFVIKEGLT